MASLIDLQAELTKKEEEFKRKKILSKSNEGEKKNKTFEKLREITSKKKKKKTKVGEWKEEPKQASDELDEIYAKSQQKLLAKSKIYEKMERGEMEDVQDFHGDTRYLVDFEQKSLDRSPPPTSYGEKTASQIAAENIYEANEEHREKLKEKWRIEQEEILNAPVHYENIKFDEVRDLGTGYYAFSKNEEERQKQMAELKNLRDETISIQKKKEQLRNKRKAALDARLMKVKQRKAAEEGRLDEFLEQCEKEKEEKEKETKNVESQNSETDAILSELRRSAKPSTSKQGRDWDQGKTESGFVTQPFVKETKRSNTKPSYEQRIDALRNERPDEFAPPSFY